MLEETNKALNELKNQNKKEDKDKNKNKRHKKVLERCR